MNAFKVTLAALLSGGLLAGCAGSGVAVNSPYKVYGERFSPRYSHGDLQFFNGDKEMLVDVVNTPFNEERVATAREIAQSMRGKNEAARIDFVGAAGSETPDETRILVAFHTDTADSGSRYCGGVSPANQVQGTGPVRMLMVYCKRDEFMSSVRAEVDGASSVDDPAFQQMLALATRRLIPFQDPFNENRGKRRKVTG